MSRPRLNMPLKEQNSPRSQWISNVSLLKNQLKDGELVIDEAVGKKKDTAKTKLTWNELEAQLGKRMRDTPTIQNSSSSARTVRPMLPSLNTNLLRTGARVGGGGGGTTHIKNNPLSPTSATLQLIPHPHSPSRTSTSITAPLPPGIPSSPSKRPTLTIPVTNSKAAKDILKQVHNGTAQLPNRSSAAGITATTIRTTTINSKSKPTMKDIPEHSNSPGGTYESKTATTTTPHSVVTESSSLMIKTTDHKALMKKSLQVEAIKDVINESKRRRNDNHNKNITIAAAAAAADAAAGTTTATMELPNLTPIIEGPNIETRKVVVNDATIKRDVPMSLQPYHGAASVVTEPPVATTKGNARNTKVNATQSQKQQQQQQQATEPEATKKTKGTMSWLRRALKPNSSKPSKRSISMSTMAQVSILTTDSNHSKSSSVAAEDESKHNGGGSRQSSSSESRRGRKSRQRVVEKYFLPTTPLQLGLWLSELQKAIRVAKQQQQHEPEQRKQQPSTVAVAENKQPIMVVDVVPLSTPQQRMERNIRQFPQQQQHPDDDPLLQSQHQLYHTADGGNGDGDATVNTTTIGDGGAEDAYYHKNRDIGVYVDYSTFDDGDSVSSMELLFKWLTCRELSDDHRHHHHQQQRGGGGNVMTPPGTVIATESNVSDDLSIDFEARPTRRTFFSR